MVEALACSNLNFEFNSESVLPHGTGDSESDSESASAAVPVAKKAILRLPVA